MRVGFEEMRREVLVAVVVTTSMLVVGLGLRRWQRSNKRRCKQRQLIMRKLGEECATPVKKLWEVADALVVDMKAGLAFHGRSKLQMLVSFQDSLPTGDEKGIYYGLNLCGTNFRVSRVQLGGKNARVVKQESKIFPIPSNLIDCSSIELLNYIAVELAKFVSTESESFNVVVEGQKKLGFTYSFPLEQDSISSDATIKWKTFSVDDTVGRGMVNDINQALERHGVDMHVSALVDETVGNLAGDRYYSSDVVAAVTLGMGTNAAYFEREHAISKWNGPPPKSGEMVINMEWGNFSCSHLPITEFDVCLDAESSNPGDQIFEKLISGMYLGEIVRRVLLKMAKVTALFGESVPPKLRSPYVLRSPDMAAMHQDTSEDREVVGEKLNEIFGIADSTPMMREVVAEVCDIVVERGGRLAGAGIVAILKKLGRIDSKQRSVVTVEGGVYQHYRLFRNYLHSGVWEMLGSDFSDNVVIENSNGGSGMGAVFLAASHSNSTIT